MVLDCAGNCAAAEAGAVRERELLTNREGGGRRVSC